MKDRSLICIVCPRGCELTVHFDADGISSVEGNACPRGRDYAYAECTAPVRTVTSTVRCEGGGMISVKTSRPVPKERIFDVMECINACTAPRGTVIGDVLAEDAAHTGADIVATSSAV